MHDLGKVLKMTSGKQSLIRTLLAAAVVIAVGVFMSLRIIAPRPVAAPAAESEVKTPSNPQASTVPPEVARFVYRQRPAQDVQPKTNDTAAPVVERVGRDWSQLLKRYVDGDQSAFQEFLGAITPETAIEAWQALRNAKLEPADRRRAYEALGKVGGGDMVRRLINSSDPNAVSAVKGWGQADATGALDWFRQLDVFKDPQIQQYLSDNHLNEQAFMDKLSSGLLDALLPAPDSAAPESVREAYASEAARLVDSLKEQDSRKAEAMMRELTNRFLTLYDQTTMAQWINQLHDPALQGAAVQRIIEAGVYKDAPFAAVDLAFSLENPVSRGPAISAAFGKLGAGTGGVNQADIAARLLAMPDGRDKDFAINGFAHGLAGTAPDEALKWAQSVSSEGFRDIVVRNVTRRIEGAVAKGGK